MDMLKGFKNIGILLGIVFIIIGGVFLFAPAQIVNLIALLLGLIVTIIGAYRTLGALLGWKSSDYPVWKLALGILLLIIGVYLLINRNATVNLVGIGIGIYAIISALDRFSVAIHRHRMQLPISSSVVFGFIHFAFGLAMILLPYLGPSLIIMIGGIYLVSAGLMILLSVLYFLDYQ